MSCCHSLSPWVHPGSGIFPSLLPPAPGKRSVFTPRQHFCLQILGSVGEPINPEAWRWYSDVIGGGRCPVVDTWWQTETGGHMITPLPGVWDQVGLRI